MSKYITPKATTWRKGPPPSVGWWPASAAKNSDTLRWWDGKHWFMHAFSKCTSAEAGRAAIYPVLDSRIEWTDRWWL